LIALWRLQCNIVLRYMTLVWTGVGLYLIMKASFIQSHLLTVVSLVTVDIVSSWQHLLVMFFLCEKVLIKTCFWSHTLLLVLKNSCLPNVGQEITHFYDWRSHCQTICLTVTFLNIQILDLDTLVFVGRVFLSNLTLSFLLLESCRNISCEVCCD